MYYFYVLSGKDNGPLPDVIWQGNDKKEQVEAYEKAKVNEDYADRWLMMVCVTYGRFTTTKL